VRAGQFHKELRTASLFVLQSGLRPALSPSEKKLIERRPTETLAASGWVRKARAMDVACVDRASTRWWLRKQETLLQAAVERDARLAAAWAEGGGQSFEMHSNENRPVAGLLGEGRGGDRTRHNPRARLVGCDSPSRVLPRLRIHRSHARDGGAGETAGRRTQRSRGGRMEGPNTAVRWPLCRSAGQGAEGHPARCPGLEVERRDRTPPGGWNGAGSQALQMKSSWGLRAIKRPSALGQRAPPSSDERAPASIRRCASELAADGVSPCAAPDTAPAMQGRPSISTISSRSRAASPAASASTFLTGRRVLRLGSSIQRGEAVGRRANASGKLLVRLARLPAGCTQRVVPRPPASAGGAEHNPPGGPFGDHGEADAIKAEERPGQAHSAEFADSHACKGLAVPASVPCSRQPFRQPLWPPTRSTGEISA
jgi:hypothetical protein